MLTAQEIERLLDVTENSRSQSEWRTDLNHNVIDKFGFVVLRPEHSDDAAFVASFSPPVVRELLNLALVALGDAEKEPSKT